MALMKWVEEGKPQKDAMKVYPQMREKYTYTVTECKRREHFKKKKTTDHIKSNSNECFNDTCLPVLAIKRLSTILVKVVETLC